MKKALLISVLAMISANCATTTLPTPSTPTASPPELSMKEKIVRLTLAMQVTEAYCGLAMKHPNVRADKNKFVRVLEACGRAYGKILDDTKKLRDENSDPQWTQALAAAVKILTDTVRTYDEIRDCLVNSKNETEATICLKKVS